MGLIHKWMDGMGSMFPLSCAPVRAHTGRQLSAYKKTWSAHKFFLALMRPTYYLRLNLTNWDPSHGWVELPILSTTKHHNYN